MEPIISVKINTLTFSSTDKPILHDIDFQVKKGDFIAITGGVASGKSSLLHCITGAIPKYHEGILDGTIEVMGQDIKEIPLPKMSEYLGYMMQDPQNQIIDVKVYEDIAFGMGNCELPREEMEKRVPKALSFVGLEGFENRDTDTLSGGQAQRVVLAGVLAMETPILILDQPTAELDPKGRRELYSHLTKMNKEKGVTIIMVMDRTEEALMAANRVFILEKGTLSQEMTPEQFMVKQNLHKPIEKDQSCFGKEILAVNGASHIYKGGFVGCNPMSLSVKEGEFVSVIGLNGSGKTTLLKMIEGLLLPTQGSISIFGEEMNRKNAEKIRRNIGFLFQNPDYQIFSDTVLKEVTFSLRLQKVNAEEMEERGLKALEAMGLLDYKEEHPQMLSRGQRQLLALASVLINDPQLIIADEPTSGLDQGQGHTIMAALKNLTNQGKTVLLVSHDLALAEQYSHRMVAMYRQDIIADFQVETINEHHCELVDIGLIQGVTP